MLREEEGERVMKWSRARCFEKYSHEEILGKTGINSRIKLRIPGLLKLLS